MKAGSLQEMYTCTCSCMHVIRFKIICPIQEQLPSAGVKPDMHTTSVSKTQPWLNTALAQLVLINTLIIDSRFKMALFVRIIHAMT